MLLLIDGGEDIVHCIRTVIGRSLFDVLSFFIADAVGQCLPKGFAEFGDLEPGCPVAVCGIEQLFHELPANGLDRADVSLIQADPRSAGDHLPAELNPVIDYLDHQQRTGRCRGAPVKAKSAPPLLVPAPAPRSGDAPEWEGQPTGQYGALDRQAGTQEASSELAPVAVDLSGDLDLIAKAAGLELRFVLIGVA